jgi:hypothetical protein
MRCLLCSLTLVVLSPTSLGDEPKTKEINRAELPKSVKVKAGERIAVIEDVAPGDIEDFSSKSTNPNIKVKSDTKAGKVRLIIESAQKGEAKVTWHYGTKAGRVGGYKDLKVEFE